MTGAADRRGFRWGRAGHSIRGAAAWPGSADSAPDQIESTVGRDGTLDGDGLVPHESLMSVSQSRFGSAAVSSRRTGSSRTGGPTRRLLPRRFADECAEDLVLRTRPPHPPLRRSKPSLGELVGDEPVPERGIVGMHVDRRVDQVRVVPVPPRDRILQPPVVGLLRELQRPARHRDVDTVGGEFIHERVEPFGPDRVACDRYAAARRRISTSCSRFACDRYAAARRRTSFSCSSNRIRFFNSRASAASAAVSPRTVTVLDIGSAESVLHRCLADTEVSGDLFESDAALTTSRDRDDVLAELLRRPGCGTGPGRCHRARRTPDPTRTPRSGALG